MNLTDLNVNFVKNCKHFGENLVLHNRITIPGFLIYSPEFRSEAHARGPTSSAARSRRSSAPTSRSVRNARDARRIDLCRSRQELSNAYFLAKFGVDTEGNEPYKFAHLAEKSEKGSISNLSTKVPRGGRALGRRAPGRAPRRRREQRRGRAAARPRAPRPSRNPGKAVEQKP